ncbi:MAG: hypothetical protein MJ117_00400 [Lachnospiraceae bacterium]|nr:hypothetical protein [Lachnospiraceae bacterium]
MPIFNNVSGWISKDKDGREDIDDQLSEVASHEMRQRAEEVRQTVSQTISNAVSGCSWMSKAARNARPSDPIRYIRTIFPVGWIVGVTVQIASGRLGLMDSSLEMAMTVMIFLAFNPMDIISRYLARQTRFLLCLDIAILINTIDTKNPKGIGAALFWTICTVILIVLMNHRWLMAYNWLYTEAVVHALVKAPDNTGVKAWDDHGKRETRTLLAECGLPSDDDTLQIFAKGIYIAGFYGAWFSTDDDIKAKEAAEKALMEKDTYLRITEQQLREAEDALEAEQTRATENWDRYSREAALRADLEKELRELKAQTELQEKERLMVAADVPEEGKSHIEILSDKIVELRKEINPKTGAPISWEAITDILHSQGYTESKSTIHRIYSNVEKKKKAS